MAGERLDASRVEASGVPGDREWGVFDASTSEIADASKAKRWQALPQAWSRIAPSGSIEVSTDGEDWGDPTAGPYRQALSELFGFPAELRRYAPAGAEGVKPTYSRSPIHLLTTASLRTLQSLLPQSVIDQRRFRPNVLVDMADGAARIPEYDWIGREIHLGDAILRGVRPCGRCSFTTLQQAGLPLDIDVLRTLALQFDRHFGIYCDVMQAGEICRGDALMVLTSSSVTDAPIS